jgi:hypothetical protein
MASNLPRGAEKLKKGAQFYKFQFRGLELRGPQQAQGMPRSLSSTTPAPVVAHEPWHEQEVRRFS